MSPLTVNIQPGQDVLTVSSMQAKLEAQMIGLGVGFLPEVLVREHVAAGRLVVKQVARQRMTATLSYGWRRKSLGGVPSPMSGFMFWIAICSRFPSVCRANCILAAKDWLWATIGARN